jgi:hypothetical protein
MAQSKVSAEKLQQVRELAAGWGKIVARRAEADSPDDAPLDFEAMERIAAAAVAGLTEGTLDALLQQPTQGLAPEQPCPGCGRLCPVTSEDRPLTVKGAVLTLHEPICHCDACRRDFFPPATLPASGPPRLQPHRPASDR